MERVWDYPRPPAVVPCERRVRVELAGETIAESTRALRVLETSHPPVIYIPPEDVVSGWLAPSHARTTGASSRAARTTSPPSTARTGRRSRGPTATRRPATKRFAISWPSIPGRVDAAWLDDERIVAQESDFYGGWITGDLVGPFKGPPGTLGW